MSSTEIKDKLAEIYKDFQGPGVCDENIWYLLELSSNLIAGVSVSNLSVTHILLLGKAARYKMTAEELEQQRRSFAYGNAAIDNPAVTKELVNRMAEEENNHDKK